MDKYGVVTGQPEHQVKTAERDELCPKCANELDKASNVPICPKCGTGPFEKENKHAGAKKGR